MTSMAPSGSSSRACSTLPQGTTPHSPQLVRTLGITGLPKSRVSVMAQDLDERVVAFRTRPAHR